MGDSEIETIASADWRDEDERDGALEEWRKREGDQVQISAQVLVS